MHYNIKTKTLQLIPFFQISKKALRWGYFYIAHISIPATTQFQQLIMTPHKLINDMKESINTLVALVRNSAG